MGRCLARRRVLVAGFMSAVALALIGTARTSAQGDIRERTLFVTVTDKMNDPVEGLAASDFQVREDGVSREVLRVSRATEPLDVAVLVDNSASSAALIPRVREGLPRLVAALTPQHSVALIALADRPTIFVDYTTSAEALQTGIGRLFTMSRSGMTLFDGIIEVSDGLRRRESQRAAIVPVITDGTEFTNRRYLDVLNALARSGAGLYPITVGRFLLRDISNDIDRDRLTLLGTAPEASGGRHFNLQSANAIDETLAKVAAMLNAQYKLVYSRPETLIPPEKIVVTSARPGLTVHGTPPRATGGSAK